MAGLKRPRKAPPDRLLGETIGAVAGGRACMRDLAVEQRNVSMLKVNPRNARTHSKRQVKAIADSIQAFGFTSPVLIDDDDMILSGHGRLQAAKLLHLDKVPAIRISSLSEEQKRAFVLAENKLAERAGWDRDLLAVELGELSSLLPDLGLSVNLTGFDVGEIDAILNDVDERKSATPDDGLILPPARPVNRLGDLWLLGHHRLLCGDARDPAAMGRLLGDEQVDLVFTTPHFDVGSDGDGPRGLKDRVGGFAEVCGDNLDAGFVTVLREVLGHAAARSRDGALHYICIDWRRYGELLTAGRAIYGEPKDLIVWIKSKGDRGRFYRSQHELIVLFQVDCRERVIDVAMGRQRSNVWRYAQADPSIKPAALVADAISDATSPGAIVLDLFGDSGTTLIAAERTGRRARLLEIAPRCADVAIARFEKITKQDAIHAETSRSYAELADERSSASPESID